MSTFAHPNKIVRRYLAAAGFCLIFSQVYEQFSHGIWSVWMLSMPCYPLVSAGIFLLLRRCTCLEEGFRQLWLCGIATWTSGACLAGVFEIYGTDFPAFGIFLGAGAVLLALAGLSLRGFDNA